MTQTEEKTFQKWSPPSPEAFRIASAAEAAKYVRAGLKIELGLSSKDCSVRSESYSMGSSIHLDLRNTPRANRAPFSVVQRIAEHAEEVRRDGSGEILSGGNRFVSVNRDQGSLVKMGEPFRAVIGEARDKLSKSADQSLGIPFEAAGVKFVYWGSSTCSYGLPYITSEGRQDKASANPDVLAGHVAETLLEAGKLPLAPCEVIETNNKRGPFFLLVPSWQLGPELFATCKAEAKSRGGWYSRAWGSTPGGFGFDSLQMAESFGLWLDLRGRELGD